MKNIKNIVKIGAGVLVVILLTTSAVSAFSLSLEKEGVGFTWIREIINDAEQSKICSTSLVLDETNTEHVFYITKSNDLMLSSKIQGRWFDEKLDSGVTGNYVSAKIDTMGQFHVAYGKDNLMYLKGNKLLWAEPIIVDPASCLTEHNDISLDLDSLNAPHISYYDGINKDLKYARQRGSNFEVFVVDSDGNVGVSSSIAVDSKNRAHISYIDITNRDVKYAESVNGLFEVTVIDTSDLYSFQTAMDIDSNDRPNIVYGGFGLKYAIKKDNGVFEFEIVDSDGTQVFCPTIKIDDSDAIHVGYTKLAKHQGSGPPPIKFDLMYAKKDNSQWSAETAINGEPWNFIPLGNSINVDSNRDPRMSFVDLKNSRSLEFVYRIDL